MSCGPPVPIQKPREHAQRIRSQVRSRHRVTLSCDILELEITRKAGPRSAPPVVPDPSTRHLSGSDDDCTAKGTAKQDVGGRRAREIKPGYRVDVSPLL